MPPSPRLTIVENVVNVVGATEAEVIELGIAGPQGPAGPAGPQGIQGPPGSGGASYRHVQSTPAATWVIDHALSMYPNVRVVDSAGRTVEGDIVYNTTNRVTLTFSAAFSGEAYLS